MTSMIPLASPNRTTPSATGYPQNTFTAAERHLLRRAMRVRRVLNSSSAVGSNSDMTFLILGRSVRGHSIQHGRCQRLLE